MKIAMFTDTYLPSKDGVVSSIILTRAQLEKSGHEVVVFAPEPWNGGERDRKVFYCKSLGFRKYPGYRIPIFPTNKCEILRSLGVDVIHSQGLLFMGVRSMWAGRTLSKPVVVSFHTMITDAAKYYADLPLPDWFTDRLFWVYLKQLLERADAVIAPTKAIKDELLSYAPEIKKIEVIPTGIDCQRFRTDLDGSRIREKYGLEDRKTLIHVGRIAREKNLDLLLNGFSMLSTSDDDVRLLIVGEGPAKQYYMDMARSLGLEKSVIFTGFVSDEELPEYYAASDAFAIASKFETQGLAALEAMACGKPVAGINYRAVAEVVKDGESGYLFEEDPQSCARAMQNALMSPEHVRKSARKRAEEYSVPEMISKLVDVYEYAIESKRNNLNGKII